MCLINPYLDKTCTPLLKYKTSKSVVSLSLITYPTTTHTQVSNNRPMQEQWVRNISFVVPILCAVYICLAPAPVLGHICHLLPLTVSNKIRFFVSFCSPNAYKCQKRVCMVEMWNLVSCVSIFVTAVF